MLSSDGKLKNSSPILNNSNKHIGNSVIKDNRDILENDTKRLVRLDDDTLSNNSLGSHKNRKLKSDSGSHKGSSESLDDEGDEKRDASKEDLEEGMILDGTHSLALLFFIIIIIIVIFIILVLILLFVIINIIS